MLWELGGGPQLGLEAGSTAAWQNRVTELSLKGPAGVETGGELCWESRGQTSRADLSS